jgi:predicted metal-dependent hydrolase
VAREEIVLHNLDRTSHPYLRETVTSHIAQDSLQQQEAREMRDQISRIESRQIQMADTLSQLKGSLEAERGRR